MDPNFLDGTIEQSSNRYLQEDYPDQEMNFPVLGVILRLMPSDDIDNDSNKHKSDQRGSRVEAEVLVVNDALSTYWTISNVIVLPTGASGIDSYSEEVPRPATQMIDGSQFKGDLALQDVQKIDGDWCLVQFVGGDINQPVMSHWFPHPGNTTDPNTSGRAEQTLLQGSRVVKRYSGAEFIITNRGSLFINTNNSNALIKGSKKGITRESRELGGDVQIDIKPARKLEVNLNAIVPNPDEPSCFQPNPPVGEFVRDDLLSKLILDKDFINAVAGRVVQIRGNNDGTDSDDTVLLGETPTDHVILGETHQVTFNAFVKIFNDHFHLDGTGAATGTAIAASIPNPGFNPMLPPNADTNPLELGVGTSGSDMPDADLSDTVKTE